MFGDQAVSLNVETIPVKTALLLNKSSMAKAKTVISVHESEDTIFGRDVSFFAVKHWSPVCQFGTRFDRLLRVRFGNTGK